MIVDIDYDYYSKYVIVLVLILQQTIWLLGCYKMSELHQLLASIVEPCIVMCILSIRVYYQLKKMRFFVGGQLLLIQILLVFVAF